MHILAFDSGIGGLTAIAPLLLKNPSARLTYFGDLAHLPYGTKSPARIRELVERNFRYLLGPLAQHSQDSYGKYDLAVVACNTASAVAMDLASGICAAHDVPCVGVIESSCHKALKHAEITVLATPGTVKSEAYSKTLQRLNPNLAVQEIACPLFVPFVEEGIWEGAAVDWIIEHHLKSLNKSSSAIVLGCTHYPLLKKALQKFSPNVEIIEAGSALLENPDVLRLLNQPVENKTDGDLRLIFSDHASDLLKNPALWMQLGLQNRNKSIEFIKP